MTVVNIEVDLGDDQDALREKLIKAAARQLLIQVSPYSDGEERFTELGRGLRDDVVREVKAEVQKAVAPAVEAALAEGVQLTDQYGSPKGEKVPLRNLIVEEATKALKGAVEYRDRRRESVVEQVVRAEVDKALSEELRSVVREEREKVVEVVRGKAAQIVTEAVERAGKAATL